MSERRRRGALRRAEELLARLEAVRARLEATRTRSRRSRCWPELAELAKEVEAELERARREADGGRLTS